MLLKNLRLKEPPVVLACVFLARHAGLCPAGTSAVEETFASASPHPVLSASTADWVEPRARWDLGGQLTQNLKLREEPYPWSEPHRKGHVPVFREDLAGGLTCHQFVFTGINENLEWQAQLRDCRVGFQYLLMEELALGWEQVHLKCPSFTFFFTRFLSRGSAAISSDWRFAGTRMFLCGDQP